MFQSRERKHAETGFTRFPRFVNFFQDCILIIRIFAYFHVMFLCHKFHSNISIPIIGTAVNTLTGGLLHRECTEVSQYHFNVFVVLLLLCVQVSRRLYECLYVSVFSTSRMHVVHYVLGLYFYTAVGLTALLHLNSGMEVCIPTVKQQNYLCVRLLCSST